MGEEYGMRDQFHADYGVGRQWKGRSLYESVESNCNAPGVTRTGEPELIGRFQQYGISASPHVVNRDPDNRFRDEKIPVYRPSIDERTQEFLRGPPDGMVQRLPMEPFTASAKPEAKPEKTSFSIDNPIIFLLCILVLFVVIINQNLMHTQKSLSRLEQVLFAQPSRI